MRRSLFLVALLASITSRGMAQDARGAPEKARPKAGGLEVGLSPSPVPLQLFIKEAFVEDELHLSDGQKENIAKSLKSLAEQRALFQKQMMANRANSQVSDFEMLKREAEVYANLVRRKEVDGNRALLKIVDEKQRVRLSELHLQVEGPFAFARPDLCRRLNLSPEQIEALQPVIQQGRMQSMNAAFNIGMPRANPGLGGEEELRSREERVAASRANTMQEIGRILNKNQRRKYDEMLGEPFDFAKARRAKVDPSPPIKK